METEQQERPAPSWISEGDFNQAWWDLCDARERPSLWVLAQKLRTDPASVARWMADRDWLHLLVVRS